MDLVSLTFFTLVLYDLAKDSQRTFSHTNLTNKKMSKRDRKERGSDEGCTAYTSWPSFDTIVELNLNFNPDPNPDLYPDRPGNSSEYSMNMK